MSIIAVCNIPPGWDAKIVTKKLLKTINGNFEPLSIICTKKTRKCYLRLSEKLDPQLVVEDINKKMFDNFKLHAIVPDTIPDLPHYIKPRKIPLKIRKAMLIDGTEEFTPGEIIFHAHTEILYELQSRYTGLRDLSLKTDHELLRNIARVILKRLKEIMVASPDTDAGFKLTKIYRKKHPHFADFQLILSTLHLIEDSQGKQRTQLNKQEFSKTNVQPFAIDNIPYKKVNDTCRKYTKVISKKLSDHTENLALVLDAKPDSEEEAVNRIRTELKRISKYFPAMLRQVITRNFVPQKSMYYKIRIYGEPYLPPKEVMLEFLKKCGVNRIFRSDRMFNNIRCKVPLKNLASMIEMDGSFVGGATIHIRLAEEQYYRVPDCMKAEMLSIYTLEEITQEAMDAVDIEDTKEWIEEW